MTGFLDEESRWVLFSRRWPGDATLSFLRTQESIILKPADLFGRLLWDCLAVAVTATIEGLASFSLSRRLSAAGGFTFYLFTFAFLFSPGLQQQFFEPK